MRSLPTQPPSRVVNGRRIINQATNTQRAMERSTVGRRRHLASWQNSVPETALAALRSSHLCNHYQNGFYRLYDSAPLSPAPPELSRSIMRRHVYTVSRAVNYKFYIYIRRLTAGSNNFLAVSINFHSSLALYLCITYAISACNIVSRGGPRQSRNDVIRA